MTPQSLPRQPDLYWRGFITALALAIILAWALPDLLAYVVGVWG